MTGPTDSRFLSRLCIRRFSTLRKLGTSGHNSYNRIKIPSPRPIRPQGDHAMLTHAQIWNALDRLAARSGLSASGLAKKAGLDPTTFNKSKRITPDGRARWPSTESVAKSLAATNTTVEVFVQLIEDTGRALAKK